MKANFIQSRSASASVDYLLNQKGARVVSTNVPGFEAGDFSNYLEMHGKLHGGSQARVVNISFRRPLFEDLDASKWRDVGLFAVTWLGLRNHPFLIVKHEREHIHVLASVLSFSGERWDDSFSYWRSMQCANEIKKQFALSTTTDSKAYTTIEGSFADLEGERSVDKHPEKVELRNSILGALRIAQSPRNFLEELKRRGVIYRFTRHKGKRIGLIVRSGGQWFKASQINRDFSWPKLKVILMERWRSERKSIQDNRSNSTAAKPEPTAPAPKLAESNVRSPHAGASPSAEDLRKRIACPGAKNVNEAMERRPSAGNCDHESRKHEDGTRDPKEGKPRIDSTSRVDGDQARRVAADVVSTAHGAVVVAKSGRCDAAPPDFTEANGVRVVGDHNGASASTIIDLEASLAADVEECEWICQQLLGQQICRW